LAPPDRQQLLSELTADFEISRGLDEVARRWAVAELNQRLADVSFELKLQPATFAALIRISLATGSALGLVSFLTSTDRSPFERALQLGIAAVGGLAGAGAVAVIGRSAKARAGKIQESWDTSSRGIGKALGTSLVGPERIRASGGNSFPE
jgi:hypothetical protein